MFDDDAWVSSWMASAKKSAIYGDNEWEYCHLTMRPKDAKFPTPPFTSALVSPGVLAALGVDPTWTNYARNAITRPDAVLLLARPHISKVVPSLARRARPQCQESAPSPPLLGARRAVPGPHPGLSPRTPVTTDAACTAAAVDPLVLGVANRQPEFFNQTCPRGVRDLFKKIRPLGTAGSYGQVFLAKYKGEEVALKEFLNVRDFDAEDEILAEINVAARLNHPNLMKYFLGFESAGTVYGVMEAIKGAITVSDAHHTLLALADDRVRAAVVIGCKLFDALAYMHDAGVAHRDLKFNNVLLTPSLEPIVIDYGFGCVDKCDQGFGRVEFQWRYAPLQTRAIRGLDAYQYGDVFAAAMTLRDLLHGCQYVFPASFEGLRLWQSNDLCGLLSKGISDRMVEDMRSYFTTYALDLANPTSLSTTGRDILLALVEVLVDAIGLLRNLDLQRRATSLRGLPTAASVFTALRAIGLRFGLAVPPARHVREPDPQGEPPLQATAADDSSNDVFHSASNDVFYSAQESLSDDEEQEAAVPPPPPEPTRPRKRPAAARKAPAARNAPAARKAQAARAPPARAPSPAREEIGKRISKQTTRFSPSQYAKGARVRK